MKVQFAFSKKKKWGGRHLHLDKSVVFIKSIPNKQWELRVLLIDTVATWPCLPRD